MSWRIDVLYGYAGVHNYRTIRPPPERIHPIAILEIYRTKELQRVKID